MNECPACGLLFSTMGCSEDLCAYFDQSIPEREEAKPALEGEQSRGEKDLKPSCQEFASGAGEEDCD